MPTLMGARSLHSGGFGSWSGIRPQLVPTLGAKIISSGPFDALRTPTFAKDTSYWQTTAIGWDVATLARVFAVPILFANGPTGGTNGATPTTTDGFGDNWDAVKIDGTSTLVISTANPIVGPASYVANGSIGSSHIVCLRKGGFDSFDHQFVRAYFDKDTNPAVSQSIIKSWLTYNSGTQALSVRINTSRQLEIVNAANTAVVHSTGLIVAGTSFRVLVEVTASTGVGNLSIWFNDDGTRNDAPDEVVPFAAGANAFGASIGEWNFGNAANNNVTGTLKFGGIAISYADPGAWENGEESGHSIASHSGAKWILEVTLPTGTQESGTLYKVLAGTIEGGRNFLFNSWVYVPTGTPNVQAANYMDSEWWRSPDDSIKDAWVKQSTCFVSNVNGDHYFGVKVAAGVGHTAGQKFYVDDASLALWPGTIANKSFEENLNGWGNHYFTWDDSTITRDNTVGGHAGDWAAKVIYPAPTANGYSGLVYQAVDEDHLIVGNTYTFGMWVYVPAGQPDVQAQIQFVKPGPVITTKDAYVWVSVTGICNDIYQHFGICNGVNGAYSAGQYFIADDALLIDNGIVLPATGEGFLALL